MHTKNQTYPELIQGSPEWHALRKTKVTGTDAPVLMNSSPWKTPLQLYNEKISNDPPSIPNAAMQRGIDLEPIARDLFILKTGIEIRPGVFINSKNDWLMASLDGFGECCFGKCVVEIKCPSVNVHAMALNGEIPDYYYPQLQHQMLVCDIPSMYYFSFDGFDGIVIEVERDNEYIKKLFEEEEKFYDCLINKTPPEPCERDYIQRNDEQWKLCAAQWMTVKTSIEQLEKEEASLREKLFSLSGGSNCMGANIRFQHIKRKGRVDYSAIPELKDVDLEKYRTNSVNTFRITSE